MLEMNDELRANTQTRRDRTVVIPSEAEGSPDAGFKAWQRDPSTSLGLTSFACHFAIQAFSLSS